MLARDATGANATLKTLIGATAFIALASEREVWVITTVGKNHEELTELANEALRSQPGCESAQIPSLHGLPNVHAGRNWEIPNVVLGDSLISDIDRAVITVHHQLGRKYHLLMD